MKNVAAGGMSHEGRPAGICVRNERAAKSKALRSRVRQSGGGRPMLAENATPRAGPLAEKQQGASSSSRGRRHWPTPAAARKNAARHSGRRRATLALASQSGRGVTPGYRQLPPGPASKNKRRCSSWQPSSNTSRPPALARTLSRHHGRRRSSAVARAREDNRVPVSRVARRE